mgnify:FL=1
MHVLARQSVAKLVGFGALVEHQLQDGPHQESIVPSTPHEVRPLGKLLELLLEYLLTRCRFAGLCLRPSGFEVLIRVKGRMLTHSLESCGRLGVGESLGGLELVHSLVKDVATIVKEELLEHAWCHLASTGLYELKHLCDLRDCARVAVGELQRLTFFASAPFCGTEQTARTTALTTRVGDVA